MGWLLELTCNELIGYDPVGSKMVPQVTTPAQRLPSLGAIDPHAA